ncbi:MAG: hypothetical protein J7K47_02250 [Thermoplasmata archaeon]|nr:hypothetical protein [Thermoplasmata archaeon]
MPSVTFSSPAEEKEIKIALYDSISPSVKLLEYCFHYAWEENGVIYKMDVSRVDYKDVINGSLRNYDALVIGASGRQYFHALNPKWKEEVKNFVANGGGYLGICGGANMASMGYEKPRYPLDFIINKAALGFIDAYLNDDQWEEWQYLWKDGGRSNIPIKQKLQGEIFDGTITRYITYAGGAGLYGMKKAKGIGIYLEEPSEVAPLHFWIWFGKWIPWKKITTDIKEYYSAAESTYGKGKVIVFSAHPEIPPRFNASVKEYFGLSIYGIPRYVYEWIGGHRMNYSYNWWILRRSIAYIKELPLPSFDELLVMVSYENGSIKAYAENAEKVEFYLDGKLMATLNQPPYEIKIDLKGEHEVKAIAYHGNAMTWDEKIIEG